VCSSDLTGFACQVTVKPSGIVIRPRPVASVAEAIDDALRGGMFYGDRS